VQFGSETLAHAFVPGVGDIHLDVRRLWSAYTNEGKGRMDGRKGE